MSESAIKIEKDVTDIDSEVQNHDTVIKHYNTRSNAQQHGDNPDYNDFSHSKPDISNMELDLCLDHPLLYCRFSYFGDKATYQNPSVFGQAVDTQQIQ